MDQRDPIPHIDTYGNLPHQEHALQDLDAAFFEDPDSYGIAATTLSEGLPVDQLSPRQQEAAERIARVLDIVNNKILFDPETSDTLEKDPRDRALVKQLKSTRDQQGRDKLRRQLTCYRLAGFAKEVVADFLATEINSSGSAA